MLKDAIYTFKNIYEKKGESFITDSYVPEDGDYIIVEPYENTFRELDIVKIKQDKKTKEIDRSSEYFKFICNADYLSKLIDIQKPIDSKKIIHSNNYLSFFVKNENVNNGKLNNKIIDSYYEILKNPEIKYSKEKLRLYKEIEDKYGKVNENLIENIKIWIKDNIKDYVHEDSKGNSYLKIFFKYDLEEYKKENEKYLIPNIFNKVDNFNIKIGEETYGLPNDNMGLNSKKPYLENKSRKTKVPYLISLEEVLLQKKFFDYLLNQVSIGKTNIYMDKKEIYPKSDKESMDNDFSGIYFRIKKGKEVEIHDFDTINHYKANIKPIKLKNVIDIDLNKSNITYNITITKRNTIKDLINKVFFSKFLSSNYFTESKDMNINDNNLKRNILLSRRALFNWFYKGNEFTVWKVFGNSSLSLIKGSIENGYIFKAGEQFNLRCALKEYFVGGESMADVLLDVKASLRDKVSREKTASIDNDKEYYFAVGQLASFLISLSKAAKKTHSLANPIINAKSDDRIKVELKKLFKKYSYAIDRKMSRRFDNLMTMVSSYIPDPEEKVNDDLIIAGYLHSSLIYEKSSKEENKNE
ncbi:type I-B CRISPR-associated protein Cas8b/Csh1 [Clostridium botulinum]|uniref:type I-B CRISPR-associated protein Cas8b/Csh1 n=1 Tax=Clostridium botulinum TaxID=1491 RepID=UPI0006AC53E6|nr:type I-B CRISPR-associated protein Cas8b/Csh1 [Clostridium botulinum]AWB30803.1 type I-B CRISPR-associated protein Cas8b/Csh1 [Clostridium botulinum]KOR54619.1 CRISPR-associated protein Csh1 [Clostridium botulinum]MBD5587496.1 type I-B CRISPR-associated protein Cas8b/Csh1 [Clostridium botulinum]MBY6829956.1 type I-B CRISPR-associated protein Cas8b/Csh1 [Clostridium botulinum]MBY6908480.1 type I-B CRISPR-associated protein Cas8b/Csh1 [Clostridium botulinum]